jgi:hypothetical protein
MHRLLRLTVAGAVAAAGIFSTLAAGPPATGATSLLAPDTAPATAGFQPLLLINGGLLAVQPVLGGMGVATLTSAPDGGSMIALKSAGEEIPADAVPYVGHGLDLSLFTISDLRHAESAGRLPVRVTFAGRRPALPGVTVTSSRTGSEGGYLTVSSARVFGAALEHQFLADHARASYGTDGMFGGHVSIALAGAPMVVATRSASATYTLTITGTDIAGQPDSGDTVELAAVNSSFAALGAFEDGAATFTVPAGRYWAMAGYGSKSLRVDVLPQFTVAGNTTVNTSARAASQQVTMATPRPAIVKSFDLAIVRVAPGATTGLGWSVDGEPLWVSPSSHAPTDGTLQAFISGQLTSPPGAAVPYGYSLDFVPPRNVISGHKYVARPGDLATVSEQYYQDEASTGAWLSFGGTAYQLANSGTSSAAIPLTLPGRQIQYMSASPAMLWQSEYVEYQTLPVNQTPGGQTGAFQLLRAGQRLTESWNAYPLHPAPTVSLPGNVFPETPSAVRAGDTLSLDMTPFSDNEFGHTGDGFECPGTCASTIAGSYAIYQNGAEISSGNAQPGSRAIFAQAKLAAKPSLVKFVMTASRAGKLYEISAASQDVWTWHSQPEPSATVPAPWECGTTPAGLIRKCAVQPMLTLNYQVHGLAMTGTAPSGAQTIGLNVGHIQLASATQVTSASAQVSFNGGKTWQPAKVASDGGGNFLMTFAAPASTGVTLKVGATDSAGDSLTETITNAYRTG